MPPRKKNPWALAPLAVSSQHVRESERFNIQATIVRSQSDVRDGTSVTNYQKLPHFDLSQFGGIVLDESSILKSTDGHYRSTLIEHAAGVERLPHALSTCNQAPPPAVCAVGVKKKPAPVLASVTVCASGLDPTGVAKVTAGTC